jgi:TonB family protein
VTDGVGVIVNTGDAKLVHRVSVTYPLEALEKGVEGHIVVQASVNNDGTLSDKTLVQCPRELCAGAVDSLSQWQFDRREASSTRAISIDFVRPAGAPLPPVDDPKAALRFSLAVAGQGRKPSRTGALGLSSARTLLAQTIRPLTPGVTAFPTVAQAARGVPTFVTRTVWMNGAYVSLLPPSVTTAQGHALNEIRIAGLSDSDWNQLSSRLPVHAGDVWSAATASIVSQVVMDFNPRMEVDLVNYPGQQQWGLWIGPAAREQNRSVMAPAPLPPGVYTAGNGVTPPTVISKYDPVYSDSARNAGVSGTVTLSVVVGSDGAPQNILVVGSLDPGLDQAAADALAKWRFRPGTKEGAPVSVQARVEMSFRVL